MSYPRLAARLYNAPLLLEPGKAEVIEAVFRAFAEGRQDDLPRFDAKPAGAASLQMERTDNGYSITPGGVAVLPVHGTLVQRAGGMDAMSGLTGYNVIGARLQAALADPKVRGVVMEFDSPGGEVAGVFELAAQIMAATKPVWAHANEMAFSAAYALAVGAQQIHIAQTGMVGSVGVIMMHVDQSQADAKKGLVYTPIYAGARKTDFSSHAPLSDSAKASAQEQVDRLYQVFVDHVASARGISADVVKGTEAGLLTPGQALDIGMADGQASLAETVQRMQDSFATGFQGFSSSSRATRASPERSITMSHEKDAPGQAAATEEQLTTARAEATTAAEAKYPALRAEGATAERARIKSILTADAAKDRASLAQHLAFETDVGAEMATALLAKSSPESGKGGLAAAMAGVDNPVIGRDVDKPAAGADKPRLITSAEVCALRRPKRA